MNALRVVVYNPWCDIKNNFQPDQLALVVTNRVLKTAYKSSASADFCRSVPFFVDS